MGNTARITERAFLASYTTEGPLNYPRKKGASEHLSDIILYPARRGFGSRFLVTDRGYKKLPPDHILIKVAFIALAVLTALLAFPLGGILLATSSTHKIAHKAVQAMELKKNGSLSKARECFLSAIKIDPSQRWLRQWAEKLGWRKAFLFESNPHSEEIFEKTATLAKFAGATNSYRLKGVCASSFSKYLEGVLQKNPKGFDAAVGRIQKLPIDALALPGISSLQRIRWVIQRIPTLAKVYWKASEGDLADEKLRLEHFRLADLYQHKTFAVTIERKLVAELRAVANDLTRFSGAIESLDEAPIKALDLSGLTVTGEHLKLLSQLPQLQVLSLKNLAKPLPLKELMALKEVTKLTKLYVSGYSGEDLKKIRKSFPFVELEQK